MLHDIDRCDAYFAHYDGNLPPPTFIATNPTNGHAHSAILLAVPVARHSASREAPVRFYGAVERGIARRLGSDRRYVGLIVKNPTHEDWRVEWRRDEPYTLEELADWLFPNDMRPDPSIETTFGAGRNVTVFDEARFIAYREVQDYKRTGDLAAWHERCLHVATGINQQFPVPLGFREVGGIARSIARWTWRNAMRPGFSRLQSWRGKRSNEKRWEGHQKPWLLYGLRERAYYYRQKAETLPVPQGTAEGSCCGDEQSCSVTTSDNSPSWGLPRRCPLPAPLAPDRPRWPHLRRQDGYGRVPIDQRWTLPMQAFAAACRDGFVLAAA
jgi:hypothetical protein